MAEKPKPQEGDHVVIVDKHGKHHHGVAVVLDTDDVVREQAQGFTNFLRDYAVVGLAVGFIIGQQAQTLIKQVVNSFVTPLLDVIVGASLQHKSFTISLGSNHASVTWGQFLYVLIDFLFVMVFIYFVVKLLRLDRLDKKKEKK
jgi:large conductance mechanosensitive channel